MTFDDVGAADWGENIATRYDAFYANHVDPAGLAEFAVHHVGIGDGTVLEVGVGTGNVAAAVSSMSGRQVIGVDISQAMLDQAMQAYGAATVEPVLLDIAERPPDRSFTLAYAVFNTLWMIGDVARQDAALRNLRSAAAPGARLVLEPFEPVGRFFDEDSSTCLPIDMSGTEVMIRFTRVHADRRRIEGQDVYLGVQGTTLAPCLFHYRPHDELDVACADSGWRLLERFTNWRRDEFVPGISDASIAVYEVA